jgi:hemoglobin/transferrin/lactoferrin receptor protein
VRVFDQNTLQPVSNALVYTQDSSFAQTTNFNGEINLDKLVDSTLFTVNHPSYEMLITTKRDLSQTANSIFLKQKIMLIDEIVVAANRWEQEKKQTPNRILTIRPSDLQFYNPQTAADMLGQTGQVFVQKSQLGGGSPMIRGFAANSVLIVVDGVRMNNAIFRSGNLQNVISVDPFNLDNTEILFGPGSVMYGSDALGGVMHFRTKSPGFVDQKKPVVETNTTLRYASANNEKTAHADVAIRNKKVSLFTSLTFSDFDHLKTGNRRTSKFPDYGKRFQYVQSVNGQDRVVENPDYNRQVYSGYHQLNLLNKISLRIGNYADVSYSFNYSTTSEVPRYDRLLETDENDNFKSAEWYYKPQNWLSNSIQFNFYRQNALYDQAKITLAYQKIQEGRNHRDYDNYWLRSRREKVDVLTANIDLERELDEKNILFYGVEWFHNNVDSKAQSSNIISGETRALTPRYPEGGSRYSGLAGYFSHKWRPNAKLALTSGVRYNRTWLESQYIMEEIESNHGAINGSVGIAWLPTSSWQINGMISSGFRAPNVDDVSKIFDGANSVVAVPNPELKPEYSYNAEISLTRSLEDRLQISATAYYTILDHALVFDNLSFQGMDSLYFDGELSKTQGLTNTSSANIYGGNFQLEVALTSDLAFKGSFTITRGEDDKNRPLRHTTPNFGLMRLLYKRNQFQGEINYQFSGKRDFEDLPLSEQQKTHLYTKDGSLAWQTLNLMGSYHFSRSITFTLGVENILNQHYRPYSSGISASGRNFIVSMRASW